MNAEFDIAIIGSGFGGSLMAMIARRLGYTVALLERGRHPRFAIGESSTPLANLLLEELAARYELPRLAPLSKWGAWQKAYPHLPCGLKRGFTFYQHRFGERWEAATGHERELLVAASPHDGVADTHWFRAGFDEFFAREAQALGAELLEETVLRGVQATDAGTELLGERRGEPLRVRARFVIDASGTRGVLQRAWKLPETSFPLMPETETLYSHFEGVGRWEDLEGTPETPPYPVDDAALHHVFAGGWIWVLRFNNGVTSAGVAATRSLAAELNLAEGAGAWGRLLERLPSVQGQFKAARAVRPFTHTPRLAFRCSRAAGPGWALLPSAAGFVDPLLSTGFPLTLLGIGRLARVLEKGLDPTLDNYAAATLGDLDAAAALVGVLYAHFDDVEMFRAVSLLYFAAVSYSESARRLGRHELAGSFLLRESPFGTAVRGILKRCICKPSGAERAELLRDIQAAIEPINVAGLGDPARRHWYPCLAEDLRRAAPKLQVGEQELQPLLRLFDSIG